MSDSITLRDWAPQEFAQTYDDIRAYRYADVKVVREYDMYNDKTWKPWPGGHRNVMSWCVLENGFAVGWNENPSRGWSFPVVRAPK